MDHDRAVTWATEKERKADIRRRKKAEIKFAIYMFAYKVGWKMLHLTRLATPYSRTMCNLNLYSKYPDGRCHWCGENHGKARKKK